MFEKGNMFENRGTVLKRDTFLKNGYIFLKKKMHNLKKGEHFLKMDPDLECLVLETQHLRIIFWILDPPGMPGVRNPTITTYFWVFGPTWDVWYQKPNIYELFLGFWTHLEVLVGSDHSRLRSR